VTLTAERTKEAISFKPGIYSISSDEYHSSEGYSRSQLWDYEQLPHKFYYKHLSGDYLRPEKDEWAIGSAWHTLVQEPHLFDKEFLVIPKFDRRTKAGKAAHAEAIANARGRTVILEPDLANVVKMAKRIRELPFAHDLLTHKDTKFEQSIFWVDETTGLTFKVRPDILCGPLCADLKTTLSASPRKFQQSCMTYGYFLQAGLIKLGLKSIGVEMKSFVFICMEKEETHSSAFYVLEEEAIEHGVRQFRSIADRLKASLDQNNWPDYGAHMLSVPQFAKEY